MLIDKPIKKVVFVNSAGYCEKVGNVESSSNGFSTLEKSINIKLIGRNLSDKSFIEVIENGATIATINTEYVSYIEYESDTNQRQLVE